MHDERFEPTGDERVDRALMGLPHPETLRGHDPSQVPGEPTTDDDSAAHDGTSGNDSRVAVGGDTAGLDSQLADVTAVHRQLQQRLSDLAG